MSSPCPEKEGDHLKRSTCLAIDLANTVTLLHRYITIFKFCYIESEVNFILYILLQ